MKRLWGSTERYSDKHLIRVEENYHKVNVDFLGPRRWNFTGLKTNNYSAKDYTKITQ